jgi:hypothetical protein
MLAQAYYYDGKFERAVEALNEYISKEKDGQMVKAAKADLEKYLNAKRIASNPLNAILVNLGPQINSKYSEINPFISKNEDILVYSSNRNQNYNIYVSKKDINKTLWEQSKLAGNAVNTVNDEFVAGLSPSGKNLFVHYNQISGFEDINMSIREKGVYRELEDPGSRINSTYREEGACMTENGDTLYFASDRPGGFGGFDLYYSLRLPDGTYGTPINLGEMINSKLDENYPNLSPDGSRLYFASKGHNSIGGFDIFYTVIGPVSKTWLTPVNLGYPINNAYDNKNIAFSNDSRYAYISTIDKLSYGDYDIYKVIFLDVEPVYIIVNTKLLRNDNEEMKPLDTEIEYLQITVYSGTQVYGRYSYDNRLNSFILALKPGTYILEIESDNFELYRKKITIDENYYKNKQRVLKINLKSKQN